MIGLDVDEVLVLVDDLVADRNLTNFTKEYYSRHASHTAKTILAIINIIATTESIAPRTNHLKMRQI